MLACQACRIKGTGGDAMRRPDIFTGSFEASVELLYTDSFDYNIEVFAHEDALTYTRRKTVIMTFVMLLVGQLIEWANIYFYTHPNPQDLTVPMPVNNLLLPYTSLIIGTIWMLGNAVYKWFGNFDAMKGSKGTIFFATWLIYVGFIFFLWMGTMVSATSYFYLTLYVALPLWFICSVPIFISKKRALEAMLFSKTNERNKFDKVMDKVLTFCLQFGAVLLALHQIFKFIFGGTDGFALGFGTDLIFFLSILAGFAAETIVAVYFVFPAFVRGYYRKKYSEELRQLEGKTQIEWYGVKYFNKQIKGTEREEKDG